MLGIIGVVGDTGPLTGFKISGAVIPGGTHVDLLTDSDFDTLGNFLKSTTASLSTAATGSKFQVVLDVRGRREFKI